MFKALAIAVAALAFGTSAMAQVTVVREETRIEQRHVSSNDRHERRDFDRRDDRRDFNRHDRHDRHGRFDRDDRLQGHAYGHRDRFVTKKVVKRVCNRQGECRRVVKYVQVRR